MKIIHVRNVHEALPEGLRLLETSGNWRDSRNGKVIVVNEPVTTLYEKPTERVLFWPERDANPFFHFMEGLWMLAGHNDVKWISQFSSNISQYSDDGQTFHGAYGHRWVQWFGYDQLQFIIEELRRNPDSRRCVLSMWDAAPRPGSEAGFSDYTLIEADLPIAMNGKSKDVPCNTHIYFLVTDGVLNMTVCNRSNDVIWGAYGANAVHMSMLQEYMAAAIGIPVGRYWQMSNNYHAYEEVYEKIKELSDFVKSPYTKIIEQRNPYESVYPYQMVNSDIFDWDNDLRMFMMNGPCLGIQDKFFRRVAGPIWDSWFAYKNKDDPERIWRAIDHIQGCDASDWKMACQEWLVRRDKNVQAKK